MQRPAYLTDHAKALYDRHSKRLKSEGRLSDSNHETWILTCEIWGQLRSIDPASDPKQAIRYTALLKLWTNYGKQFALFSRTPAPVNTGAASVDQFGIPQ